MPPSTPVAYVDETGVHVPDFPTIQNYFLDAYRSIYGADVYLDPDGQDGQLLGIFSLAISDANASFVGVYNSFSPATAIGDGLSRVVKVNGIVRKSPTRSSVDVFVIGQAGITVTNGVIQDVAGFQWLLPPVVVIPLSGQTLVTATCAVLGAVSAPIGSVNKIVTTQAGWQSVLNEVAATPGDPVETDAQLRIRQRRSTAIPSLGIVDGLAGDLWSLSNVRSVTVYANDTGGIDERGVAGHSLAVVIDGGDANAIADMIARKKGGGVSTTGTTAVTTIDAFGVPSTIRFFRPTTVPITWVVTLEALGGYTMNIEAAIAKALSDWTNALGVGGRVRIKRAYVPANLSGGPSSETFELTGLAVARDGLATADADVPIAFWEQPICDPSYVQFHYPLGA
jgi:uncharacterized phage protein gp47/JayE